MSPRIGAVGSRSPRRIARRGGPSTTSCVSRPGTTGPSTEDEARVRSGVMTTGMRRAGEVARLAGVSTDTIRHYERKGLLPRVRRSSNGYREYPAGTEQTVRLLRMALTVGFTLEELSRILAVRARGEAPCRTVRTLAGEKLRTMDDRLPELQGARDRPHAARRAGGLARPPPGRARGLGCAPAADAGGAARGTPRGPGRPRRGGCAAALP